MSIKYFLILGIVFIGFLFLFAIFERTNMFLRSRRHYNQLNSKGISSLLLRGLYLLLFVGLSFAAVSTMKTYIYPSDENVFRNVDYHVLSHKGYEVGSTFYLANGYTSEDDGYPAGSLWDSKDGEFVLRRTDSCMIIREFTDPVYVRKDTRNTWWQFWKDKFSRTYHLVNPVISADINDGFVLTMDNDTVYSLRIEQTAKGHYWYVSTVYGTDNTCITDTSTFTKAIQQGYPLLDIIAKSPRISITEDMENLLEGTYLVRKEIPMDGNTPTFDSDSPSPLCLMPGLTFYQNENLRVNGEAYDFKKSFQIQFSEYANNGKLTFFSGIGKGRSEDFRLSYLHDDRMRLEFLKPDMRHLKDTLGRVFINSSIEDVSKEGLNGGYLYNKFVSEDNHNHINAHLQYGVSDALHELSINILDLNEVNDDQSQIYKCDSEFLLHSRDKTSNAISWIFEVTDLRATNDLQGHSIVLFILLMFIMLAVRVLSDSLFEIYSLSLTELAIYIILFSLSVVRLILGWRSSTFIPIDDISLPMFLKMRSSIIDFCIWIVACMPLMVTLCMSIWKRHKDHISNSLVKVGSYLLKPQTCLFVFVLTLLLCYILGHTVSSLNRLCNIPLPIIAYFVLEIWMNRLKEQKTQNIWPYRLLAFLSLFGYLFKADAGFTIIFLAYMIVHYLVLENWFRGIEEHCKHHFRKYSYYFMSIISVVILLLILRYEGEIMIFFFEHIVWLMAVFSGLLFLAVLYFLYKRKQWVMNTSMSPRLVNWTNRLCRWTAFVVCSLLLCVSLLDVIQTNHPFPTISSILNSKAHMRYRAEIQRLDGAMKIDDLIQQCEFDSDDIIFIMRSAHNQWFINQYIRAGQKMEDKGEFFHIQPHSNQGATYTTQTTDLVVTRYILAEHGESVVKLILIMWMMLILLFVLEFKMNNRTNRLFLNGPILIYIISLMVYLSATNRIVFVGQDLPMISLQSRVALLFPLFLLSLMLGRCLFLRVVEGNDSKVASAGTITNSFLFIILLFSFTMGCLHFIEQKGKDQDDSQFDVSNLVLNLSKKVDDINDRFGIFQDNYAKVLRKKTVNEIWEMFTESENGYNKVYFDYLNPDSPDFFSSLLHYFNERQTSKTDVNQLLHLRRRGGMCYLALNKQHYFIPAIMREEERWTGNIFAARIEPEIMLFEHSHKMININSDRDYEKNVLTQKVQRQIPDMPLMRFDEAWTPRHIPLFLISSKQGQSSSVFFHIGTDSLDIKGDGQNNQIATAIQSGDVLSLYKKDRTQKNAVAVLNGNMTNNGTPHIVRNMWLNGHKRLFFPLGKQSMWTYHLGNLVSDAFSKSPELKDTTLYLSLDFELMKALNNSINSQISQKVIPPKNIMDILSTFNEKTYNQQCDSRNNLYYDKVGKEVRVKSGIVSRDYIKAAAVVNRELKKVRQYEHPLSKALQNILRTQYDFTAVVIDGDGHIRALYDYSRNRHIDPNNVSHLNRVISELYQEGSNADERDIFGSKALQYIPIGPGSSFKPIAYTAITSQEKLNWESIDVTTIGQSEALASNLAGTASGSTPYAYYGGVSAAKEGGLNIQGDAVNHDKYLVKSNNLYHSVIILLGMQNAGSVKKVMKPYTNNIDKKKAFPVFTYDGQQMCFNPNIWYENKSPLIEEHDLMTEGLYRNFHVREYAPRLSDSYTHLFGDDKIILALYEGGKASRGWVFPETSSLNNADRNLSPLKIGFNQILLGANPLQQTPLQMAINAYRLASLNRTENVATILDGDVDKRYEFFDTGSTGGWNEQTYLDFTKRQIWEQLRQVPLEGTARGLKELANSMACGKYGRPYYLYCKTGTLNDDRPGKSKDDRMKHLLVIITNQPLEQVKNVEELKQIRFYALYLSYLGINENGFVTNKFRPYIEDVLNSISFMSYMNKK